MPTRFEIRALLAVAVALTALPAAAVEVERVRDVLPGVNTASPVVRGGTTRTGASVVYVAGRNPDGSRQLWRTDGTPAGTILLADSVFAFQPMPDGGVYWTARTVAAGLALFRSDGTSAELAWDPVAGPGDGLARAELLALGQDVIVTPVGLSGLWSLGWSHGGVQVSTYAGGETATGSHEGMSRTTSAAQPMFVFGGVAGLGRHLAPHPADPPASPPHRIGASGAALCGKALAPDQPLGVLYCADATRQYVERIHPGGGGAPVLLRDGVTFYPMGERLAFFRAVTSDIWVTDGSDAGTFQVGGYAGSDCLISDGSDHVFFEGASQLMMATGAPASARPIVALPFSYSLCDERSATRWKNRLAVAVGGLVLTDGSAVGTEAWWNYADLGVSIRGELAPLGDWMYFAATNGSGTELYRIRWPRLFGDAFEDE